MAQVLYSSDNLQRSDLSPPSQKHQSPLGFIQHHQSRSGPDSALHSTYLFPSHLHCPKCQELHTVPTTHPHAAPVHGAIRKCQLYSERSEPRDKQTRATSCKNYTWEKTSARVNYSRVANILVAATGM